MIPELTRKELYVRLAEIFSLRNIFSEKSRDGLKIISFIFLMLFVLIKMYVDYASPNLFYLILSFIGAYILIGLLFRCYEYFEINGFWKASLVFLVLIIIMSAY